MKLLLDIGNSSLKWALSEADRFCATGRFPSASGELGVQAMQAWSKLDRPAAVYVSNVAGGECLAQLQGWLQQHWQLKAVVLESTAMAAGVRNGYASPGQLGIDRWAALVAARARCNTPVCVVDCGTAITLDLLDGAGVHRGGLILAGIELMQAALHAGTAGLPQADHLAAPCLLADNTGDAIAGGSVYAAAAAIERISDWMADSLDEPVERLLTGGAAARILPLLESAVVYDPELVLKGVAVLSGAD